MYGNALPGQEYPRVLVMSSPDEAIVGRTAHVSVTIPGGDRPGEVIVRVRGGAEAYIAYSERAVGVGTQVVVVDDRGARTLVVAPL